MPNLRARLLRKSASNAERKLWYATRLLRSAGYHFRRQAPFDKYIVDQVCHRYRLVIEVDGSQHGDNTRQVAHDALRTGFLEARGYRVLRFWNSEVLTNTRGVMEQIVAVLDEQRERLGLSRPPEAPLIPAKKERRPRPSRRAAPAP
jgi:very-short-patch-repair endonuclease